MRFRSDLYSALRHSGYSAPRPSGYRLMAVYAALAAGTLLVFAPIVTYEFVEYDDGPMIVEDPRVSQGLTREGLRFALTGPHLGNWHPLTTLSHQLDCWMYGVDRAGLHHVANLLLHVASVLVLFEALRRMTGEMGPSALVAALFAIHPLRVESVAWVAERKDVLSGLFFMLTLLAYAEYARRGGLGRYLLVSLMLLLGLASKPMLVTLPCVLLLLDWWPLRRWRRADAEADPAECAPRTRTFLVLEKLPWLAAALALSWVTWQLQHQVKADGAAISWSWRALHTPLGYMWYIGKTFWPADLCALYVHPALSRSASLTGQIVPSLFASLGLVLVTVAALSWRNKWPYLAVGWFWFLGMLLPVIGLIQVGSQAYADRYAYLPTIGIYLMVAWTARDLVRARPQWAVAVGIAGVLWIAVLAGVAVRQVRYWSRSEALLGQVLRVAPDNAFAHFNLGNVLLRQEKCRPAIEHYSAAVQANPSLPQPRINLGVALQMDNRFADAIEQYQAALRMNLNPSETAKTRSNLGRALQSMDRLDEAIDQYRRVIELNPRDAHAHNDCGLALVMQQKHDDAIKHFQAALKIRPDFEAARINLQRVQAGRQPQR